MHIYIGPSQSSEHRCLEYHYTKYIGPPQSIEHRGLAYHYTIYIYIYICHRHGKGFGRETMRFGISVIFGIFGMDASGCTDELWQFFCVCRIGSISRIHSVVCFSISMHPDLFGGL